MSTVTQEMILEYMKKKGGRVKNVDLVKHFRKHLLFEDKQKKEQARELFKETVNSVAVIKQEEGEKFLYLKDERSPTPSLPATPTHLSSYTPASNTAVQTRLKQTSPSPQYVNSNAQNRISQSNLGRPTDLSNGRPVSIAAKPSSPSPVPYQYQNGNATEFDKPEERTVSPRRTKSPVPLPQNRPSPRPVSNTRETTPPVNHTHPVPQSHMGDRKPNVTSPSHSNSPRVMSPPRTTRRHGEGTSLVQGSSSQMHQPVSSSNSIPHSHSPSRQAKLLPQLTSPSFTSVANARSSKRKLEISGPMNLSSTMSNDYNPMLSSSVPTSSFLSSMAPPISIGVGSAEAEKLLLDRYTLELQNVGNGPLLSTTHHDHMTYQNTNHQDNSFGSHNDLRSPHMTTGLAPSSSNMRSISSESSSLSSTSAVSASSPPPVDISSVPLTTPNTTVKPGHKISQTGTVGVQKLIQQYMSPPGSVPSATPTDHTRASSTDQTSLSPSRGGRIGRSTSSASNHSTSSNVQLRREQTPPDGKVQRSNSSAANNQIRRSRFLERNSTLDSLTRQSIKIHHKISHRMSRNSDDLVTNSKEELHPPEDPDRDSPINERDDDYVFEIEPLEKEWLLALITGNLDEIHKILLTDSTFINKKGFLHGWTALHWAAKEGNEELIRTLILSGAGVDIKSNGGLTPLHLAAESGREDIIRLLVYDYNASTNVRDRSGRRPIDMLHPFSPETMKTILRIGLKSNPEFRNESLAIAMGISTGMNLSQVSGSIRGSTDTLLATDKKRRNQIPKNMKATRKGHSFRRKNKYVVNSKESRDSFVELYHDRKDS